MVRVRFLSASLCLLLLILTFNAYACLIPLYTGWEARAAGACTEPTDLPDRDYCDAFRTLGIQASPNPLAPGDWQHVGFTSSFDEPHPSDRSSAAPLFVEQSPPSRDLLILISVFRI